MVGYSPILLHLLESASFTVTIIHYNIKSKLLVKILLINAILNQFNRKLGGK